MILVEDELLGLVVVDSLASSQQRPGLLEDGAHQWSASHHA